VILASLLCVILMALVARLAMMLAEAKTELRKLQDKQPVCGCRHHLAYHDKKTGQCNNFQPGVQQYGKPGTKIQCKCRQYVGPEPLPEYFSPEISS